VREAGFIWSYIAEIFEPTLNRQNRVEVDQDTQANIPNLNVTDESDRAIASLSPIAYRLLRLIALLNSLIDRLARSLIAYFARSRSLIA